MPVRVDLYLDRAHQQCDSVVKTVESENIRGNDPMRRICAPLAANEAERLSYLHRFGCLDTPRNPKIDRIAAMAARIFNVHSSIVTLVDHNRQWLKSPGVWTNLEAGLEDSFCAHTILKDQVLVCEDTARDPRFCHKAAVLGKPSIRFYAGAPLIAEEGIHLGAFCVVHTEPRFFGLTEQATLRDMAAMVMDELRSERDLREMMNATAFSGRAHH
jgi:GAF domain-containing protein